MSTRTVTLVGGPKDGERVVLDERATHYVVPVLLEDVLRRDGAFDPSAPTHRNHNYIPSPANWNVFVIQGETLTAAQQHTALQCWFAEYATGLRLRGGEPEPGDSAARHAVRYALAIVAAEIEEHLRAPEARAVAEPLYAYGERAE